MLQQTWQWAIIWPIVIIAAATKLHHTMIPKKAQYAGRHIAIGMSTAQWKEYQHGMYNMQASLYMTTFLASMKGSKGGRKNVWGKASSIKNWYRRQNSAEIFSR